MLRDGNIYRKYNEALNDALYEALNTNEVTLLRLLNENPDITQKQVMIQTSLSRSSIQRMTRKLETLGYLERIGSKKTGRWIVKHE